MVNYWANLYGHKEQHPTKAVLQQCWEQGRGQRASYVVAGKIYVEALRVKIIKMSPTVVITETDACNTTDRLLLVGTFSLSQAEREKKNLITAFSFHINGITPKRSRTSGNSGSFPSSTQESSELQIVWASTQQRCWQ